MTTYMIEVLFKKRIRLHVKQENMNGVFERFTITGKNRSIVFERDLPMKDRPSRKNPRREWRLVQGEFDDLALKNAVIVALEKKLGDIQGNFL